ncbi:MucR family transcriptional regulator [Methylobacterium sp. NPDC080182]|uniref:MucR family transcriptional regulator n=1 Tax=Methylobacterium sp. NPDC080182 TaxID=3390590 RepID=UPI003D061B61
MTANVVASYVANNPVPAGELAGLLASVHKTFCDVCAPNLDVATESPRKLTRAEVRKSVTTDALISFEDGRSYKTLRRHLTIRGLTPDDYRAKWGLPKDYPMTAQSYSEQRSALALSLGLGKTRRNAGSGANSADIIHKERRGSTSRKLKGRSDK